MTKEKAEIMRNILIGFGMDAVIVEREKYSVVHDFGVINCNQDLIDTLDRFVGISIGECALEFATG